MLWLVLAHFAAVLRCFAGREYRAWGLGHKCSAALGVGSGSGPGMGSTRPVLICSSALYDLPGLVAARR